MIIVRMENKQTGEYLEVKKEGMTTKGVNTALSMRAFFHGWDLSQWELTYRDAPEKA